MSSRYEMQRKIRGILFGIAFGLTLIICAMTDAPSTHVHVASQQQKNTLQIPTRRDSNGFMTGRK
ncbi:hypothetical protein BD311DRAFT_753392 [Dichomitus squalens]|uniref:Uncharacterized protein n=1 Tax=Dichomitus squalens TaxID=114155 RepID=A0A4Q9MXX5_9APHY|nr:hypothetical protein BD311DRAFT_753392 [Dichomitus squalens]